MDPLQIFLVAPPGPARDRVLSSAPGARVEILDSAEAYRQREGEGQGILLMGPGLPPGDVLGLLAHEADREIPRVSLLVTGEAGELQARPVSLGGPLGLPRVAEIAGDPEGKGPVLDLHWVLRVVAKARHDLNNPLTSGLAEAQLLLMDEHPPEVRESLETIQEQFRRLRDMVANLSRLRAPRKEREF